MFLSSTLSLSPPSSSLLCWQIVNPHCGASSGRALGPYFRGQIHHVWCGWCSHNSSLTGIMIAGIIQHSINTRAWRKYGAFVKTVNRKSFLQKPEKKKNNDSLAFPRFTRGLHCYIAHAIWRWQKKCQQKQKREANLSKYHILFFFFFFLNLIYFQPISLCKYKHISNNNNNNSNFSEICFNFII